MCAGDCPAGNYLVPFCENYISVDMNIGQGRAPSSDNFFVGIDTMRWVTSLIEEMVRMEEFIRDIQIALIPNFDSNSEDNGFL